MQNNQLSLIRRFCDTTRVRLSSAEKDLLCRILENPSKYDGFESEEHKEYNEGRDYRGRWDSVTKWKYRINIDSALSIDEQYMHSADGYVQDKYWGSWNKARRITEIRRIIEILQEIENEL